MNLPSGWQTAQLRVQWHQKEAAFSVPVKAGPSSLIDLLPPARTLAGEAVAASIARATAEGKEISCRAGCGACCRQLVAISLIEAQSLADLVAAMPGERQAVIRERFADAIRRLEAAGLLGPNDERGQRTLIARDQGNRELTLRVLSERYFSLQIACPFLEDESCGIHPDRPLVCREHHVTTPADNCSRLYELNVDRLEPAVRMGEALARTIHEVTGQGAWMIPLVLSLEWAENHAGFLTQEHDGVKLFETMLGQVVQEGE